MVSAVPEKADRMSPAWWQREDLAYTDGRLLFAGRDLAQVARKTGTPVFAYSGHRIVDNIQRLLTALDDQGLNSRLFYAIKANRNYGVLRQIRQTRFCGIDACSPDEVQLALKHGFNPQEISYTGTSVANSDLDFLAGHPKILVNCDAISTIRRLADRCPNRSIGLRVNPQLGAGYHAGLSYHDSSKATKFGIYRDRFEEALTVAADANLTVERIHFHCGSGFLSSGLATFESILERVKWFLDRCPGVRVLNVGGGLGVPLKKGDLSLDLNRWAEGIGRLVKPRHLELHTEPGDYIVKDAGIMILEVNTVEEKGGAKFIGVNGGFGIQNLPIFYKTPLHPLPVIENPNATPEIVSIAGHINEAIDLFAENIPLPPVCEGDLLAFLNAGGYGTSAASNHCMRGDYVELMLD